MDSSNPATEACEPSTPTYTIFRDKHGIPQFSPKRGTQALKDALIYSFPTLATELQLMQAALRKFFDAERGSKFVFELPQNDLQTSLEKSKSKVGDQIEFGKASLKSCKLPERGGRRSRASSRASSRAPSRPPSRAVSRVSSRAGESSGTRPGTPVDSGGGRMTTWVLASGMELEGRKKMPYDPIKRRKVAENRGNVCERHRISKTTCDPELCPDNKAFAKATQISKDIGDGGGFSNLPTVKEVRKSQIEEAIPSGTPDASEIVQTNDAPRQTDFFWDASETPDLSFDDNETLWTDLSLTNSHSTSWTSQASNIDLPAANASVDQPLRRGNELGDPAYAGYDKQHFLLLSEDVGQTFNPLLVDVPNLLQQHGMSDLGSEPAQFSEDPFMGWTSKKTSQICEDYGWVLSHVGTL